MSKVCRICDSDKYVERHHLNYLKDITINVCRKCHRKIHYSKKELYDAKPVDELDSKVIRITKKLKKELDQFKTHPRQSYNEVVHDLLLKDMDRGDVSVNN